MPVNFFLAFPMSLCQSANMNLRREFEKLIEKKQAEIEDAQKAIASAEAYIQAMTDAIKKLPKDEASSLPTVRPGSDVQKIRDAILKAGKPLHISEIIYALGRTDDVDSKAKIAGLLGWYTSKGKVFSKVAPNTFGLVETAPPELPDDFGGAESEADEEKASI
jgi:hypothetical protein